MLHVLVFCWLVQVWYLHIIDFECCSSKDNHENKTSLIETFLWTNFLLIVSCLDKDYWQEIPTWPAGETGHGFSYGTAHL